MNISKLSLPIVITSMLFFIYGGGDHTRAAQPNDLDLEYVSAIRLPGESFEQAAERQGLKTQTAPFESKQAPVLDVAEEYLNFDPTDVPLWLDGDPLAATKLEAAFRTIRDVRSYQDPEHPELPSRRVAWLYPDDGCYVRAALFNQEMEKMGLPRGWKIFAFGDLRVPTLNHPDGEVLWWFHVAPVFRLKEGLFVADPSLFTDRPIKLKEWLKSLAPDHDMMKLHMVTCDSLSFNPHSRCIGGGPGMDQGAIKQHPDFLFYEWNRQIKLGRNPLSTLGDRPPWDDHQKNLF